MERNTYRIVLASNSPRRKELLAGLDLDFTIRVMDDIDESYPDDMPANDVAEYIATKKADAYRATLATDELLITADTVVICGNQVLGKPKDANDARQMLTLLSGKTHHVVTGVCLTTTRRQRHFAVTTAVTFDKLSTADIDYYISHYKPFDKAGAYGIQEWIGYVGVTKLEGSYFNVMGLPVQRIFKEIRQL